MGAVTYLAPQEVGHSISRIEDVRLFVYRDDLYLMFEAMRPENITEPVCAVLLTLRAFSSPDAWSK